MIEYLAMADVVDTLSAREKSRVECISQAAAQEAPSNSNLEGKGRSSSKGRAALKARLKVPQIVRDLYPGEGRAGS